MIDGSDLPQIHIANFDCCACAFLGVPKKLIFCERFELQLPHKHIHYPCILQWLQKLSGGIGSPCRKVWTQTKILSPNISYFVVNCYLLRFTHFLEIFGQKKCLFGSETVFFGQEVHYYMVYVAYCPDSNLQVCNYAQMAVFALAERQPTSATLLS